jgi:hypothetical protein
MKRKHPAGVQRILMPGIAQYETLLVFPAEDVLPEHTSVSARRPRQHLSFDLTAQGILGDRKVVLRLKIHP